MILGGDLSNYDWPFDTTTAACLKAAGWQQVILGSQDIVIAEQQLAACRGAGLPVVAVYAEPSIGQAVTLARWAGVKRIWIVCETPGGDATVDDVRAGIAVVRNSNLSPGIYSGKPTWLAMGNSSEFAALPLWFPDYYDDGHYQQTVDFGGWTSCEVHQYGVAALCGRNRDHDVFWEDDMTPEQEADLNNARDFITGGATNPKGADELKAWLAGGSSMIDGYADLRQRVANIEQALAAQTPSLKRGDTVVLQ